MSERSLTELTLVETLKELCRRDKRLPLILLPSRWWEQIPACGRGWAAESLSPELQSVGGCALGKPGAGNGERDLAKRQSFPFQHFNNPTELSALSSPLLTIQRALLFLNVKCSH